MAHIVFHDAGDLDFLHLSVFQSNRNVVANRNAQILRKFFRYDRPIAVQMQFFLASAILHQHKFIKITAVLCDDQRYICFLAVIVYRCIFLHDPLICLDLLIFFQFGFHLIALLIRAVCRKGKHAVILHDLFILFIDDFRNAVLNAKARHQQCRTAADTDHCHEKAFLVTE